MNSQDFLKSLFISETNSLGIIDIFLAITVPFVLSLFIAFFYKRTTHNNHYSYNFILSLPLFSALTSIITLLIGSNIARAFGLVGALSLIRFRTALKEPIDSIFLFWSLAVGMACGTGFYLAASFIVTLGIIYMLLLYKFKFAASDQIFLIVKAKFKTSTTNEKIKEFESNMKEHFSEVNPLNLYIDSNEKMNEYVYSAKLKKRMGTDHLINELKAGAVHHVEILNQDSALYI